MNNMKRKSFTLIELLVVVAIIAVLVGILVPTLSKARESAKRARCQANLRSIGQAVRTYMDENFGFYPPMGEIAEEENTRPLPRKMMGEILKPFVGKQVEVFHCPSDLIIGDPGGGFKPTKGETTWYEWQGSSYDPASGLSVNSGGTTWDMSREDRFLEKIREAMEGIFHKKIDIEDMTKVAIIHDYQDFHALSRNALYADFHVAPLSGQ